MVTSGIMNHDVSQVGTQLKLSSGQRVMLIEATNLPVICNQTQWYARPYTVESNGMVRWSVPAPLQTEDTSILVCDEDVTITK